MKALCYLGFGGVKKLRKVAGLDISCGGKQAFYVIFDELELWFDPVARFGPDAMAVDEVLLRTRTVPLLRVYEWADEWGSVGYFGKLSEAREKISGVEWVRRWTGGGIVDHRNDWTYSLIVPAGSALAGMRGGESYRLIHEILTAVLEREGCASALSRGAGEIGGLCFENPVEYDVIGTDGEKLAGAAQRRSKLGLLHQGSVIAVSDRRVRGEQFAAGLARKWSEVSVFPDENAVGELVSGRYGRKEWLARR